MGDKVWWSSRRDGPKSDAARIMEHPLSVVDVYSDAPFLGDARLLNVSGLYAAGMLGLPRDLVWTMCGFAESLYGYGSAELELMNEIVLKFGEDVVYDLNHLAQEPWQVNPFYHIYHGPRGVKP